MWYDTTVEGSSEPKDFAGQKIAVLQGTREEYLWAKELEYAGLSSDDVQYEYFSSNAEKITAFVSGAVDAVMGSKPFKEQLEAVTDRITINDLGGIDVASQGYVLADETLLSEQPEVVAGYLKALQESMDYIDSDLDDAAQVCADYLTLKKDDVISAFDSYNYEVRFLQEDYDHLQDIADWCYNNGVTDEIQVKDYMNIESVQSAFPDKVTYQEN
jgi:NitT/TauT family transport system substrate-binding protein